MKNNSIIVRLVLSCAVCLAGHAFAVGNLDPTFGNGGKVTTDFPGASKGRAAALQADGSISLELELGGLEEIQRWILSWGKHARVLAPKKLLARVQDEAREIAKLYEKGDQLTRFIPSRGDDEGPHNRSRAGK